MTASKRLRPQLSETLSPKRLDALTPTDLFWLELAKAVLGDELPMPILKKAQRFRRWLTAVEKRKG